jgi:hypothetical protein
MQSTLNGGGKGEVFYINDNITTFCQIIGGRRCFVQDCRSEDVAAVKAME